MNGTVFRAIRKVRGFTLKEVSERIGLSLPFLSDVERGDASASIKTIQKLCNFYGTRFVIEPEITDVGVADDSVEVITPEKLTVEVSSDDKIFSLNDVRVIVNKVTDTLRDSIKVVNGFTDTKSKITKAQNEN